MLIILPTFPKTVPEIVHAVETRYSNAKTLQAKFYERYRASGQPSQSESGTVYFSKPGRMRWEYESPSTKLFLVDGVNVWLYLPADRTASRAKLKESDDWRTPLALLTGKVHLDRLVGKRRRARGRPARSAQRSIELLPAKVRSRRRKQFVIPPNPIRSRSRGSLNPCSSPGTRRHRNRIPLRR